MSLLALLARATPGQPTDPDPVTYPIIEHPITSVPSPPAGARPNTVAPGETVLPPIGPYTETAPSSDGSGVFIHPSVVDMGPDGWSGYRYWLADTPFPNTAKNLENPEVLASQDGITWVVPYGVENPLVGQPTIAGFNSDTEMVWDEENKRMWLTWRRYANVADTIYLEYAWSTDGHVWNVVQNPPALTIPPTMKPWMSPAISRNPVNGRWRMYLFGGTEAPGIWESDNLDTGWEKIGDATYIGGDAGWHGDIIPYRGYWIGVVGVDRSPEVSNLLLSRDGVTFVRHNDGNANMLAGYRTTLSAAKGDGYIDAWKSRVGNTPNQHVRVHEQAWWNLIDQLPA